MLMMGQHEYVAECVVYLNECMTSMLDENMADGCTSLCKTCVLAAMFS